MAGGAVPGGVTLAVHPLRDRFGANSRGGALAGSPVDGTWGHGPGRTQTWGRAQISGAAPCQYSETGVTTHVLHAGHMRPSRDALRLTELRSNLNFHSQFNNLENIHRVISSWGLPELPGSGKVGINCAEWNRVS